MCRVDDYPQQKTTRLLGNGGLCSHYLWSHCSSYCVNERMWSLLWWFLGICLTFSLSLLVFRFSANKWLFKSTCSSSLSLSLCFIVVVSLCDNTMTTKCEQMGDALCAPFIYASDFPVEWSRAVWEVQYAKLGCRFYKIAHLANTWTMV